MSNNFNMSYSSVFYSSIVCYDILTYYNMVCANMANSNSACLACDLSIILVPWKTKLPKRPLAGSLGATCQAVDYHLLVVHGEGNMVAEERWELKQTKTFVNEN